MNYEIHFRSSINIKDYPEAHMYTTHSIVVEIEDGIVYPVGDGKVRVNLGPAEIKVYSNVDYVTPHFFG